MYKEKCPVCGKYEVEIGDECPYCYWELDGTESDYPEDEIYGGPNHLSIAEAKRLLAEGKDVYGDPLAKE
jgi:hypothetical protein